MPFFAQLLTRASGQGAGLSTGALALLRSTRGPYRSRGRVMQSGAARYLCIVQQFSESGAIFLIFRIGSEKGYQPAGISTWHLYENMTAASSPSTKKSIRPHRKSRAGCGLCKRRKVKVRRVDDAALLLPLPPSRLSRQSFTSHSLHLFAAHSSFVCDLLNPS
jgi:hypothetical protein